MGHLEAQFGADVKDDVAEDGFGVEQGTVHIEDGGVEGRQANGGRSGKRCRCHPWFYRPI
ncbi:hypothetical protein D3C86_1779130 [compost metagenome]